MLLAIDVGNTNSKFAMIEGDRIVAQWRLRTEAKRTADEYAAWVTQLMQLEGFTPKSVKGVILASVVPAVTPHLRRLCEHYFAAKPLVVGDPDCELGIKVLIDRPAEAGADRLVGVIRSHQVRWAVDHHRFRQRHDLRSCRQRRQLHRRRVCAGRGTHDRGLLPDDRASAAHPGRETRPGYRQEHR